MNKVNTIRESIPSTNEQVTHTNSFQGTVLNSFTPTNEEEVRNIIKERGIKTSSEDPIPAKLLKSVIDDVIPFYVHLVNKSFSEGNVEGIKQSVIDPLLKKFGLDCDDKKHYRPVSNLVFLSSKLIERVVLQRLDDHMNVNNLHRDEQFGYKKYHSTETMILGIVNDILSGFDEGKATIMVFLDLSAAFDTIDIEKMLVVLSDDLGIQGLALEWCKSFLLGRKQRVQINGSYSESLTVEYGVPQGSSLGPKFFNAYVRSQPEVFHKCEFKTSSFADDANGKKTFALTFQYSVLVNDVPNLVDKIVQWMNAYFLKINPDKTEIVLFHPKSQQNDVIIRGTMLEGKCIRFSKETKNVGVWLDENLTLESHTNRTVSHCYKLLRDIGRVRNMLTNEHTAQLVHAVISSKLDYCNSLYINIDHTNLFKLQKVQNAAARLVVRKGKRHSITPILRELHWLKVEARIVFKVLLLTHKSVNQKCSNNLAIKYKSYNYRPEDFLKLETTKVKTKYGMRMFNYASARFWNTLPLHLRILEDTDIYKKEIKTLLFGQYEEFMQKVCKYK